MESFILGVLVAFICHFFYEKIEWLIIKAKYKGKAFHIELRTEDYMQKIIAHNKKNYDVKYLEYFIFSKLHYKAILIQKP